MKLGKEFLETVANMNLPKPQTNADYIRGMSDEELARWFNFHTDCEICPNRNCKDSYICSQDFCVKSLLDWLKAPVDKEGEG